MDLTNSNMLVSYRVPREMPVSELLTGNYIFSIPSYQRGYRWESSEPGSDPSEFKQVDDLLNDLTSFVTENNSGKYYLQPLMVKPRLEQPGTYVWDVLDGQQRLTTMLLILKCLNEKLKFSYPLYSLQYKIRKQLDFNRITFDPTSDDYDFPDPSVNLDSYFVRKAKDRIERWFEQEVKSNVALEDSLKKLLFYPDPNRDVFKNSSSVVRQPDLRAIFIWYNVAPIDTSNVAAVAGGEHLNDIEVFNRLNRGKIGLTDSELIKALFLIALKKIPESGGALLSKGTLVRKWDEMGKKFQNDEFWKMIAPQDKEYSNRMDLLFDFIRDCKSQSAEKDGISAYRFYYSRLRNAEQNQTNEEFAKTLQILWEEVKHYFDTLCKWHENVTKHNYIGYLVENGEKIANLYGADLKQKVKEILEIDSIDAVDDLKYYDRNNFKKIRKILLLFNVLTCDKYGQKFPFDLYRDSSFDVEHINSQTDNPIQRIEEKKEWIKNHALDCLELDSKETDAEGLLTQSAKDALDLIKEGERVLEHFRDNGDIDRNEEFKPYRERVERYYAFDASAKGIMDKDTIGNLTLLNSSINREYRNALFPKKLRTIKRSDQEGTYIPLCTKYAFLKYYTDPSGNPSAFSMMRWREADQVGYVSAIKDTINSIF